MSTLRTHDANALGFRLLLLALFVTLDGAAHAGAEPAAEANSQSDSASIVQREHAQDGNCEDAPCKPPRVLTVVYQTGIIIDDEVNTRATAVLKAACQVPDCVLELHDALRGDVVDSVRSGANQVGLLGLPPAEADQVAESHHLGQLDALLITPPGYSVVAKLVETSEERGWAIHESIFAAVLYSAAFMGLLVGCVMLMNWQPPMNKGGAATRLDPHLRSASNAMYWIFGRWSGRLVGALWVLVGFGFFVLLRPPSDEDDPIAASADAPNQGIIDGAYPGRHVSQLRYDDWTICDDVHECFRNLREGRAEALAGDRDLLCHFQRESGGRAIEFKPDEPFLPVLQAFVFPNTEQGRVVARLLLDAMNESAKVSNPWRPCQVGERTAGALR